MVSQWLVWTLLINEVSLTSQHIKGSTNIISESLIRDFYITDKSLTNIFKPILPPHAVASFHIKPLTRDIISCILSLSAYLELLKGSPSPLLPISLANGVDSEHSLHMQGLRTDSWIESHKEKNNPSVTSSNKCNLLHGIVKSPVLSVSAYFWTALWSNC